MERKQTFVDNFENKKTGWDHEEGFHLSFVHGDTFYLKGKHVVLRCEVKNGFMDIRNLVKENFHKIQKDSQYEIMVVSNDGEHAYKAIEESMEPQLICIHHYFITWSIKKEKERLYLLIKVGAQSNDLLLKNFEYQDQQLTLSIVAPDNYGVNDAGSLLLYRNEKLQEFNQIVLKNNLLVISMQLDLFYHLDSSRYGLALYANNTIYHLKTEVGFMVNAVISKDNEFKRLVHIEIAENATIQIQEREWLIEPEVTMIAHENDMMIMKGYLKHDLDIFHYDNVSYQCVLNSFDDQKTIPWKMEMDGYNFTLYFKDSDIYHFNEEYFRRWDLNFNILLNEEVAAVYPFTKSSALSGSILFTKSWLIDAYRITLEVSTTKIKDAIYFSYRIPCFIQRINYVEMKRNAILFHVRMNQDIDTIYKNLKIGLGELGEGVLCKVKKRGKRALILTYKGPNQKELIELIKESKCPFEICFKEENYRNHIWDFDRSKIYNSFTHHALNSNRYRRLGRILYRKIFLRLPIKRKKVLFESFLGRNVSGNPKYLYQYMDIHYPEYKLYWILNDTNENIEGSAKKIQRRSIRYYYHMATAGYWMFNTRQDNDIVKRDQTTYLQTWHGTPLKRLGMDMDSVSMATVNNIVDYKREFVNNSRRWDFLLAQNQYSADIFRRCFAFRNELLCDGYPANDILFNASERDIGQLKDKFHIPKDKKVVLYAPTWRDDNFLKKGYYQMKMQLDLAMMKESLGDDTIVLLRMHYLIMNSLDISDFEGFAYDFSNNCDIQELYLLSDILITDYSSTMFDFANLKRPIIFFAYDIDDYRDSLRGFYFDFEGEAPGPIVKTTKEVIHVIKDLSWREDYHEKEEAFYKKFNHIDDGNASKRVLERVLNKQVSS